MRHRREYRSLRTIAPRRIVMGTTAVGMLGYPFLVYAWIESHPSLLVALLGVLTGARLIAVGKLSTRYLLGLLGIATFCALAWWVGSRFQLVKTYPVLVSMIGASYALWTLAHPPSAAERLARLSNPTEYFDERKITYTRRVTAMWAMFFIANGSVATYTAAWTSTGVWTMYNGLISYLLIGGLFGGEYLFRLWYRKRHYPTSPAE